MNILVKDKSILAVSPVDNGDAWVTDDAIIPKHVADGAAIVEVDSLPPDYYPGGYTYDNGFVPVVIAPVIEVPKSVTMRQARLALLADGLLDDIDAAIAGGDRAWQIEWEYAAEVLRNNPIISVVKAQNGLTDKQIDDLFIAASKL